MSVLAPTFFQELCAGAHGSCACGHHAGAPRPWSIPEVEAIQVRLPSYAPVVGWGPNW